MMDTSCAISVFFFFLSNVLGILLFDQVRTWRSVSFNYQKLTNLEPDYLIDTWIFRFQIANLESWSTLLNAFAWFSLIVPVVKLAWILSNKGNRFPGVHGYMVLLVFGGSFAEMASRLLEMGLQDFMRWIVIQEFNLVDWETSVDGNSDGMGYKVIEMMHLAMLGLVSWVDSIEFLVLFQILLITHISILYEKKDEKSFPKEFAYFGLFIGLVCIFDFTTSILTLEDWRKWTFITFLITALNRVILFPIWLILLGRILPEAIEKCSFKKEAAVTNFTNESSFLEPEVIPPKQTQAEVISPEQPQPTEQMQPLESQQAEPRPGDTNVSNE